jgi:hypothetical protein
MRTSCGVNSVWFLSLELGFKTAVCMFCFASLFFFCSLPQAFIQQKTIIFSKHYLRLSAVHFYQQNAFLPENNYQQHVAEKRWSVVLSLLVSE